MTTQDPNPDPTPPAPPTFQLLDGPPPIMRRPLDLFRGHAYAAAWLYVRVTHTQTQDKLGNLVQHDPPLVQDSLRLFVVRGDGTVFGPGGDHPLDHPDLGVDIDLPELPHPSRTWSARGVKAYRKGVRPDPVDVLNRVADVVSRFVDFDRSLADQRTMAELVACFVLATWLLPAFNVIGYLWPSGERGSGKTVLLNTVAEMAYLGHVVLAGGTYASLRDLAEYGATLAFDDAENIADPRSCDGDKRALLLAGNRRGSTITVKQIVPGRAWRTRHVNAFCPRLFSAIRLPDSVLASRTIVIPLVRTPDRHRANADPLDYDTWPHQRRPLIDDLWALALAHLPHLRQHERDVSQHARLTGRNLEPWRAILAVARWLDEHDTQGLLKRKPPAPDRSADAIGASCLRTFEECCDDQRRQRTPPTGLWCRLEDLAVRYQRERFDLQSEDFDAWVVLAICSCAISAVRPIRAIFGENPDDFEFTTQEIVDLTRRIAISRGHRDDRVTSHRIGRALARMRLQQAPRPGGKGSRRWRATLDTLQGLLTAHGLPPFDFSTLDDPPTAEPPTHT